MSVTTKTAVPIVEEALRKEGLPVTPRRVWAVMVTARAESGYGTGWKSPPHGPDAPGSKNWGAVQAPGAAPFQYLDLPQSKRPKGAAPRSPNPEKYFYALDYNPFHVRKDGGNGSWFYGPYRSYPSDVEGAREVVRLLQKKGALDAAETEGTTEAVARASYGYYTGMTTDKEKQIATRANQLWDQAEAIAKNLGVSPVLTRGKAPAAGPVAPAPSPAPVVSSDSGSDSELPTLRIGSRGNAVELWQRLINADPKRGITLKVDGDFGAITLASTRHWQSRKGVKVDGVIGPVCWGRVP